MRTHKLVRSIVLAIASLALAGVLFVIYQYSSGNPSSGQRSVVSPTPTPDPASLAITEPISTPEPADTGEIAKEPERAIFVGKERIPVTGSDSELAVNILDPDGRARADFRARAWKPIGNSSTEFEFTLPTISLRTPNGQLVRISGDKGVISLKSADPQNPDPKSGHLIGNVHVLVDRLDEEERKALDDDEREILTDERKVELTMEDLFFDLEYARLETGGAFTVESKELSLSAIGLVLRYNEVDNRIEELTIAEGKLIELRGMGDRFALNMPVQEQEQQRRVQFVDESLIASTPEPIEDSPEITSGTGSDEDLLPLLPTDIAEPKKISPTDVYTAVFAGDVSVTQYTEHKEVGRLLADELEILFDFGQKARDIAKQTPEHEEGDSRDAEGKEEQVAAGSQDRILLNWSGELRVTSKRKPQDEIGDEQRLHVTASGSNVVVSAPQRRITCKQLEFFEESRTARVLGKPGIPAHIVSADMGEIWGMEIFLDRNSGRARATGPAGRLIVASPTELSGSLTGSTSYRSDTAERGFEIRFDGELHAEFVEAAVRSTTHPPSAKRILKSASFTKNVELYHGLERIRCDRIDLRFETTDEGRAFPALAEASGNVMVSQGDRFISARDKMIVDMEMLEAGKQEFDMVKARQTAIARGKDPDTLDWVKIRNEYESKKKYRPGLRRLQAFGEVEVGDPDQELEINCHALDCSFSGGNQIQRGVLTPEEGRSAFLALGEFSIASPVSIPFDIIEQKAHVNGPGRMTFLTTKDFDNGDKDDPMLVSVKWSNRMSFDGPKNEALFSGQIQVEAQDSTYECDELRLDLVDEGGSNSTWWIFDPLLDKIANRQSQARESRFELASPRGSLNKDLAYLYATGNVVAIHSRIDPDSKRLLGRVRISGPTMAIDRAEEYVLVDGRGNLLIEDYRHVESTANDGESSSVVTSTTPFGDPIGNEPSQTYIAWKKAMNYRYTMRVAEFEKDVQLVHRTGSRMKLAKQVLGEEQYEAAEGKGRESTLNCQDLVVKFSSGKGNYSGTEGQLSGRDVEAFNASGGVFFVDSTSRYDASVTAIQITYTHEDQYLQILGSDSSPVEIITQRGSRPPNSIKGPRFYWNRETGKILAPRSRGRMN